MTSQQFRRGQEDGIPNVARLDRRLPKLLKDGFTGASGRSFTEESQKLQHDGAVSTAASPIRGQLGGFSRAIGVLKVKLIWTCRLLIALSSEKVQDRLGMFPANRLQSSEGVRNCNCRVPTRAK